MVQHVAGLIGAAARLSSAHVTRILALSIDTRGIRRAIKVPGAGQRLRRAYELSNFIDDEAVFAHAHGLAIAHLALLVSLAGEIGGDAWVATFARWPMTRVRGRAIVIRLTGDGGRARRVALGVRMAYVLGLTDVALRASAARLVQHNSTEGIYSACVAQLTRVQALQVYARLLIGAL